MGAKGKRSKKSRPRYECAFLGCRTGVEAASKPGARAFCFEHRAEETAEETANRLALRARQAEAKRAATEAAGAVPNHAKRLGNSLPEREVAEGPSWRLRSLSFQEVR